MGLHEANGTKLLLTLAVVVGLFVVSWLLRAALRALLPSTSAGAKLRFWSRQVVSIVVAAAGVIGLRRSGSTSRKR